MHALRTLLTGLIDYAGLFPPAALDMPTVVRNYAAYRGTETAWILGRLIVPMARLDECADSATDLLPRASANAAWRLSALAGTDVAADSAQITAFNQRFAGAAVIDTIELKANSVDEIEAVLAAVPSTLTPYVEVPIAADPHDLIAVLRRHDARAKVRTGGVTPDAFPATADLVRFIATCGAAGVPFKATAGLHHPLRGQYRLTYAADSPTGMMYGFLNVFLTAALLQAGMPADAAAAALEESAPTVFQFDHTGVTWRSYHVPLDTLASVRQHVAIAFGSCSFAEPIDDLKAMRLL